MMLSKAFPAVRALRAISRVQPQVIRCMSGYQTPANWKTDKELCVQGKITLNDLPVPQGSWQEDYNKKNTKNNIMLVVSVALFAVSWSCVYAFGGLYMHNEPPLKSIKFD